MNGITYEPRRLDKGRFLRWIAEVQRVEFAEVTGPDLDRLKIKTARTFDQFRRFIVWLAASYGSYGVRIHPDQSTMSEDYGLASTSAISRWLAAARHLGWLEQTCLPDSRRGIAAEHQIAPFWDGLPLPAVPREPFNLRPQVHPQDGEEPPF